LKSQLCGILLLLSLSAQAQTVSTVAGIAGAVGGTNGPAASSTFNNPHGIACDQQGNLYIANRYGHNIRKITPSGTVSTFAGGGSPGFSDGTGAAAAFNEPWAVTCDTAGNVYVADTKNYSIRKITPTGVVTTLAGTGIFGVTNGPLLQAEFGFPTGIAVNKSGSLIYVADRMTHTIRKIYNGQVTTFAGTAYLSGSTNGTGSAARFDHPYSIAMDAQENIYVADEYNNMIRKVTPSALVSTHAGDGSAGSVDGPTYSASFNAPWGITCDAAGNLYVGEGNNFLIRKIAQDSVKIYAGQDGIPGFVNGPALQSSFNGVSALVNHAATNTLYLCDPFSQLIRKIAPLSTQGITLATSTGATTFCSGSAVTLNALPFGLSNYTFYNGTSVVGTSATGTLVLTTLTPGSYSFTCSALNGSGVTVNSNVLNVSVSIPPTVTVTASGTTTICNGDTVSLTATATGTLLWSTGATTQTIKVTTAGTYAVTVTNSSGCSATSAPISVTLLQAPLATITSSTTLPVCTGDSVQLSSSSSAAYLWSNGSTSQNIYATSPGNYTVVVTNGAGCSAISLPQTVVFYPSATASITPSGNVPLVNGGSVLLTSSAGQSYQWSTGASTQTLTVTATGTYTVTVTDANGCKSAPVTSQVIPVDPATIISYTGLTTLCQGQSLLLTSAFGSGNQWFKNGTSIPGATTSTLVVTQSGYYHVQYTVSPGNIIISDSLQVTVLTLPATVQAVSDTVCAGESAQLSVAPQSGITYNWYAASTGGSSLATGLNYTTPPLTQQTSYWIEPINTFGCVSPVRHQVIAPLLPSPVAAFTPGTTTISTSGFEVPFTNNSTPGASYLWDFGDPGSPDNTSVEVNPVHFYSAVGDYPVILIVANSFGCFDTLSQMVQVRLGNNIFIPTGFTPNGDGNNDLFRVRGNNILYSEMSVYNPWGQRIYYSSKETKGWDGTLSGAIVPNGNYAYVITVQYETGNSETFRGSISVIR
jgi:gliding motility-associated-like protein